MSVEHDLRRKQRLIVLDSGIVDARHVAGREHPHDSRNAERCISAQHRHTGMSVCGLNRPCAQHPRRV